MFLGDNAHGKTNLLEAISVLATGWSPFTSRESDLVRWGQERAILRSSIRRAGTTSGLDMWLPAAGRRAVKLDGLPQRRLADILGVVNVVLFSREDLELVRGAPAGRRDFLDRLLVQLAPLYYEEFRRYSRAVAQRNTMLKQIAEGAVGVEVLEAWDGPVIRLGAEVARRRAEAISDLVPRAARWHSRISSGGEILEGVYQPGIPGMDVEAAKREDRGETGAWAAAFADALTAARSQDLARRMTVVGPHRDDLVLKLDGREAKSFASTGQRRTIALALKLAELEMLKEVSGEAPLLLLDDVLAELDVQRQNHLLAAIGNEVQTFVTTTHLTDFTAAWIDRAEVFIIRSGAMTRATAGELSALARADQVG